jgi:hypothetical protein
MFGCNKLLHARSAGEYPALLFLNTLTTLKTLMKNKKDQMSTRDILR